VGQIGCLFSVLGINKSRDTSGKKLALSRLQMANPPLHGQHADRQAVDYIPDVDAYVQDPKYPDVSEMRNMVRDFVYRMEFSPKKDARAKKWLRRVHAA